ncbi:hypothetical protein FEG39_16885 [Acinetobacter baumannii]|nr:hypothetical protein FEG39_16885 [Acinetobacter baumannii]
MEKKFRAFVAGFGSGKTWVGCSSLCNKAWEFPKVPLGYFAPTYPQIRDIFFPTIEEVAFDWGLKTKVYETNKEVDIYYGRQYRTTIICRSILVPVEKDGKLVGERPFVMDERRVKDIPKEERSQLIGQLDANTTFREFFKKTDDFFQREWLGPKRYKLYKEGKFDFDKFFDPEGRLYTLDQLRKLDEQTFKELGL